VAKLAVADRIAQVRPDTDPKSIASVLARESPQRVQFSEPLPERLLEAVANALARFPEVGLRVYGRSLDPSLAWLEPFAHVGDLTVDLWQVTSFDRLASFRNLRRLSLGETSSKKPSLAFVRDLLRLEVLYVEAHDRDFEAIGEVETLRQLHLRVPRAKNLDPLGGLPRLELIEIDFGAIRDLRPLAEIPCLLAVGLYQVRELETTDLDALGECPSLLALSLGALRNVTRLSALAGRPRGTLRYLTLERMTGWKRWPTSPPATLSSRSTWSSRSRATGASISPPAAGRCGISSSATATRRTRSTPLRPPSQARRSGSTVGRCAGIPSPAASWSAGAARSSDTSLPRAPR
jgi:hypothetical protein